MKRLLALALFAAPCFALQSEYLVDTGSTTVPTTFGLSAQLSGFTQIFAVQVANNSNQTIEVNCNAGSTQPSPCSTGLCVSFHVPAGATVSSPDNVSLSGACWMRANTAAPTAGLIIMQGWGW